MIELGTVLVASPNSSIVLIHTHEIDTRSNVYEIQLSKHLRWLH